ncbi:basic amino acid ABC transporter substrate-binding protein [Candidatus Atribacteria bacterium 1244-E10-H5-B2]|jgi:polar amino acid transport system substrate-binding protein|uniref:Solute-binding protein family 3/N-terminal domain-containing protein n=1 Tax=marine sediment metagenome TaxID=412755 RepID=X0SR77_9ZZZZ|nr:MAG: basic amino acid ABC transporter substrate-binding protein [Candidatus Atribacteria bacterium 1244-E10-H5-B2]
MRNKKLVLMVIFSLLIVLCTGSISLLAAEKYINGIDADYPPFAYIDEKGNPAGFDVECLNWIAQEMGFEVKHQPTAWDGIVSSLLAKKIDMVYSGMSITEERKTKVDFTIPYWEINQALCVREDSDLNIIAALCGKYTVGSQRGCTAAEWIEEHLVKTGILAKDNLKLYEGFSLAVKDLLNGRIDSAMMDDVMVEDAIRKGQAVKIVGIIKTGEAYGIAVRKEDKELKALLNEGIAKLEKSTKWDELIIKYFSE